LKGCSLDNLSIPTATVSGSTHSWSHNGTWLNDHSYPFITNGVNVGDVYTDTIRDANGCVTVYKAVLKQKSFNLNITAPDKIKCHDDSTGQLKATVNLETNGPLGTQYVYTWTYPSPYTSPAPMNGTTGVPQSVSVNHLHPGTYTCTVHSGTCVMTKTFTLDNPAALPDDSLFSYFCPKDSMAWLYAEAGHSSYHWIHNGVPVAGNNNDSIAVTPATVGEYIVWYTTAGCRDTARKLFTFYSYHAVRPDKLVNVFTPNGDDRNDAFYPFHDANISQYEIDKQMDYFEITIYNRWGVKVYETTEYAKPWDGTVNGTNQDDGTYYYLLRYKSNCATKADVIEKHGFVQLLR
jgi:gliding motility-associated-like protein